MIKNSIFTPPPLSQHLEPEDHLELGELLIYMSDIWGKDTEKFLDDYKDINSIVLEELLKEQFDATLESYLNEKKLIKEISNRLKDQTLIDLQRKFFPEQNESLHGEIRLLKGRLSYLQAQKELLKAGLDHKIRHYFERKEKTQNPKQEPKEQYELSAQERVGLQNERQGKQRQARLKKLQKDNFERSLKQLKKSYKEKLFNSHLKMHDEQLLFKEVGWFNRLTGAKKHKERLRSNENKILEVKLTFRKEVIQLHQQYFPKESALAKDARQIRENINKTLKEAVPIGWKIEQATINCRRKYAKQTFANKNIAGKLLSRKALKQQLETLQGRQNKIELAIERHHRLIDHPYLKESVKKADLQRQKIIEDYEHDMRFNEFILQKTREAEEKNKGFLATMNGTKSRLAKEAKHIEREMKVCTAHHRKELSAFDKSRLQQEKSIIKDKAEEYQKSFLLKSSEKEFNSQAKIPNKTAFKAAGEPKLKPKNTKEQRLPTPPAEEKTKESDYEKE